MDDLIRLLFEWDEHRLVGNVTLREFAKKLDWSQYCIMPSYIKDGDNITLQGFSIVRVKQGELLNKADTEVRLVGDKLALAAARVCTDYDGVHRLRAALAEWYNLRAGVHKNVE